MEEPDVLPPIDGMSDDDILSFTQGSRKRFVKELTERGFPTDPKEQTILLTTLSDMDRAALGNKRIGAAEKQSAADLMVSRAITQITSQYGGQHPFERGGGKAPEADVTKLPKSEVVPGETDVGLSDENYENLIKKFEE